MPRTTTRAASTTAAKKNKENKNNRNIKSIAATAEDLPKGLAECTHLVTTCQLDHLEFF